MRSEHLERFYAILDKLERRLGGARILGDCTSRTNWPLRGVYFFREAGELRSDGRSHRVVRVGTHAIEINKDSILWDRLRAHRGTLRGSRPGGGYHRSSRFRLWVGTAILARDSHLCPSWMVGNTDAEAAIRFGVTKEEIQQRELPFEMQVSAVIRAMPFLWLSIDDAPGPDSERAYIEGHSTKLLSNYHGEPIDASSKDWLGQHCASPSARGSGLWSVEHVTGRYDPVFLDRLETLVERH